MPLYAFGSLAVIVGALLTMELSGHAADSPMFVALLVSAIPSIGAFIFAERSSRDIRNGVLEKKAQTGAAKAIQESGAAHAVVKAQSAVTANKAAIDTLITMLENHLSDKEVEE